MAFLSWYVILFYSITLSCGLLIFRTWRSPNPRPKGWLFVAGLVLGITWVVNLISMQWAVLLGGIAWLFLMLLPSLGLRKIQTLIYRQKYQEAYYWTLILRFLHPFDGWWEQPKIIKALQLAQQGNREAAQTLLTQEQQNSSLISQQAIAMNYALNLNWGGLLAWMDAMQISRQDPLLTMYYCRALGETEQLHELLLSLESAREILLKGGDRRNFNLVQLFAAAFCGEVQLVEQLTSGSLAIYAQEIKDFWVAIAYYTADQKILGEKRLKILSEHADRNFQNAVKSRLQNPPRPAKKYLKSESYPLIAKLSREIQQENIESSYQSLVDRRPLYQQGFSINSLLVTLNSLVFLIGIVLNFKIERNALINWGSFIPNLVWHGEWWRIITATFIHAGWAHLLMNMFTLILLGSFAEKHLGRWRYLTIYLLSGVAAMVTLLALVALAQHFDYASFPRWLVHLTAEIRHSYQQWVGASGSIMGMIGAIAVILFKGWRELKSKLALKQFRFIVAIIIFQFAIDLSSENVSFYSHLLGFFWGSLFTFLLTRRKSISSPKPIH